MKTIVITGPESTGKTLISSYLAGKLRCPWIAEYARDFIGNLNRQYTFDDLAHIAAMQVSQKLEAEKAGTNLIVLDTWLIITKIWFLEVFNKVPGNLDEEIKNNKIDLYIVCSPDIPWEPDPLRENGGEKRNYLMKRYVDEIEKTGSRYVIITGEGEERYQNALEAVRIHFPDIV